MAGAGIASFLAACLVFWVGNKRADNENRKVNNEGEAALRAQLMEQIRDVSDRLKSVEEECRELRLANISLASKNMKLEAKLDEQFNHLSVLHSYFEHIGTPCWLKGIDGRMIYINTAYEKEWSISRLKYEGNTDYDVWPKGVADKAVLNDNVVLTKLKGLTFKQRLPVDPEDPNGEYMTYTILKWPVMHRDEVIGVGGAAFRQECKE